MHIEAPSKSKSLRGVTDLTLLAPIKPGLIPALDARSYASRLRLLLRTLGSLRASSLEAEPTPLIQDAIGRIRAIHSFRLALVGSAAKPQLLLSVAFDGGWEPYMRRIWGDLGPLLDVIFCNCEGYLLARQHDFPAYMGWVRSAQIETEFFYNDSGLTVADVEYVRESARLQIDGGGAPAPSPGATPAVAAATPAAVQTAAPSVAPGPSSATATATATETATATATANPTSAAGPTAASSANTRAAPAPSALDEALPALVALYRLCDMYPPAEAIAAGAGEADGLCLQRAAVHLLQDVETALVRGSGLGRAASATQRAALAWFCRASDVVRRERIATRQRRRAAHRRGPSAANVDLSNVQAGILEQDSAVTHGALLLLSLRDAAAASALIKALRPDIIGADRQSEAPPRGMRILLAFTPQGLRTAGVADAARAEMPPEFLEGMAARASILGDVRENHPTRWSLPPRNWPAPSDDFVELASVDAVVHLGWHSAPLMTWDDWMQGPNDAHPLRQEITRLHQATAARGVNVLSVQPLQRFLEPGDRFSREHFGFADGFSQPSLTPPGAARQYSDRVAPGDLLLGHPNSRGDPVLEGRLWNDSTFLVIRKLAQDVPAFEAALPAVGPARDAALLALIGRSVDGVPAGLPAHASPGNDFDYTTAPHNTACPLHAHVRRANPRLKNAHDGSMGPRILRRGMSYGPRYVPCDSRKVARGLVFMSFQASIAEQFEVIQGWLSGGNSAGKGSYSAQRDALLGVRDAGDPCSVAYGPAPAGRVVLPARPLAKLDWGLYLFVPSLRALDELQTLADDEAQIEAASSGHGKSARDTRRQVMRSVQAQTGAAVIAQLRQAEALGFEEARLRWKIALEDVSARMSGTSRAVWTAVRELHGGVLRTPYGVLVCGPQQVKEVFDNGGSLYSVSGYAERMARSFGPIYLGLDTTVADYRRHSAVPNAAILGVGRREAFDLAFVCTCRIVARMTPARPAPATVEVRDLVDRVLAAISQVCFGIPDGRQVVAGGFDWNWKAGDAPTCPGHFHSPSRYLFQPHPGPAAARVGERHGQTLKVAVGKRVEARLRRGVRFGRIGEALGCEFDADMAELVFGGQPGGLAAIEARKERLASTLIGVMMGFLPTVDGNLRGALYEWVSDRSLWDLQTSWLADLGAPLVGRAAFRELAFGSAEKELLPPLVSTLKLRPVPEVVWRTALQPHRFGGVDIKPGDTLVVSIVSATQAALLGNDDVAATLPRGMASTPPTPTPICAAQELWALFGGVRRATTSNDPITHACPGAEMAIGVMLGVFAGLMHKASMRPTFSPMSLRLTRR